MLDGPGAVPRCQQVEVQPVKVLLTRPEWDNMREKRSRLPSGDEGYPEDALVSGFWPQSMCREFLVEEP